MVKKGATNVLGDGGTIKRDLDRLEERKDFCLNIIKLIIKIE